jgi:parallel beta-helix repeat protein
VPSGTSVTVDVYQVDSSSSPVERRFLGTGTATTGASPSTISITNIPAGVTNGTFIVATASVAANGTSVFASPLQIAAPFVVTTAADNGSNTNPTSGSLRAAILNADQIGGSPTITFTGAFTIMPPVPLPAITTQVIVDGNSAPGVEIVGNGISGDGLVLGVVIDPVQNKVIATSAGSTIQGLDIFGFNGAGIRIQSDDNHILNNTLGATAAGTGNVQGVLIDGGSNNTIGGTASGAANTIEFNSGPGIFVQTGPENTVTGGPAVPVGNDFRRNQIVANGGAGGLDIDFSQTLVNHLPVAPFPVAPTLIQVSTTATGTFVTFALTGVPATEFAVEFFINNPTGSPPSRAYSTTLDLTLSGSGTAVVTETFANELIPSLGGASAIATATVITPGTGQPTGTSRFSNSTAASQQLVVSNAEDNPVGTNPIIGSLRQAILLANQSPSPTTIVFQIGPGSEESASTFIQDTVNAGISIPLDSPLPTLAQNVTIDGFTEADFLNTLIVQGGLPNAPVPRVPLVILDTSAVARPATPDATLTIDAAGTGSTVRGLIFNQKPADSNHGVDTAILLENSGAVTPGSTIAGNIIGFYPFPLNDATNDRRGFDPGIVINNSNNNVIGDTAFPPNVISGNSGIGILISGTSTNNLVQNTFVGTDVTGMKAVGNTGPGIKIDGASQNIIGGASSLGRNVISANFLGGVVLNDGASQNVVQNSDIGTDALGQKALGNGLFGVEIDGTTTGANTVSNSIGGTGLPNVISGNSLGGVVIDGGAQLNVIQNSYIGLDATGKLAVSNGGPGVTIEASGTPGNGNSVGGATSVLPNVISGNLGDGVLFDGGAQANVVQNSYIGLDVTGTSLVSFMASGAAVTGNTGDGVQISGSSGNSVGAPTGPINVISGNTGNGVEITFETNSDTGATTSSDHTTVINSFIGTDVSGLNALGNKKDGILIAQSDHTDIGFYNDGAGDHAAPNLISGNVNGIHVTSGPAGATSSATDIQSNKIGTDTSGKFAIPNTGFGIFLDSLQSDPAIGATTIGGTTANAGNLISGNGQGGLQISGGSGHVFVLANKIGTDVSGSLVIGNVGPGITILNSAHNTIGENSSSTGNSISGNAQAGILIQGSDDNLVQGNTISANGTAVPANFPDITVPLSNYDPTVDYSGIMLLDASFNTVGGTTAGTGNTISSNKRNGILVAHTARGSELTQGNLVLGNLIGSATTGQTGNLANGVLLYDAWNNTVGGTVSGAANTILSNANDGVLVFFTAADNTQLPVTIAGNLVSTSTENGIHVIGDLTTGALQIQILGNLIGTNSDGSSTYVGGIPQGNGLNGILLEQAGPGPGASSGTAASVTGNVSSDNGLSGIEVQPWPGSGASALAHVSITSNKLGTDASGTNVSGKPAGSVLPFGNALDGLLLNGVLGVTVGGTVAASGNVVSGNLGRGIEIRGGTFGAATAGFSNLIESNLIGTDLTGEAVIDSAGTNLGNLSDGIYLLNPGVTVIQNNTVSNNRGAGIHAAVTAGSSYTAPANVLTIFENKIGTDTTGLIINVGASNFGNGSDGIFLDGLPAATAGPVATIQANVISGNHANGINLLKSIASPVSGHGVLIEGNFIGTNAQGNDNDQTNPKNQLDFGNAGQGIFVNQSGSVTIGGTAGTVGGLAPGAGNVVSGNHGSGIFFSGTSATATSMGNVAEGNFIGVDSTGSVMIANAVAGIVLSNADSNVIGGTDAHSGNVISGNRLDGILVANNARNNSISGNVIGTNSSGLKALGNSADGIFLIGGAATVGGVVSNPNSTISGNVISGNIISGNNENGIQIFGRGSRANTVSGNVIGMGSAGTIIPNSADGVLLDTPGPGNVIGGPTTALGTGGRNVISGNSQSGIAITDVVNSTINATTIEGNLIGTDATGTSGAGNGGYGVQIYGSSGNTVGGATGMPGTGLGNVISGNALAGVQIFGPTSQLSANYNLVAGNWIGSDKAKLLGNASDGIQIFNASYNTIGGTTSGASNVISGNAGNGVLIDAFPTLTAQSNQVIGNFIGTNPGGSSGIGNLSNGIEILDGIGNSIGGTTTSGPVVPASIGGPGNVISGNTQWGIQILLTGAAPNVANSVLGNYIGTGPHGLGSIPNQFGGVLVNDLSISSFLPQLIGGSGSGAGNLISGNAGIGIELLGPQLPSVDPTAVGRNNIIEGNLIGLDIQGAPDSNGTGVLIDNSPGNVIGGFTSRPGTGPGNIISGNISHGVHILGTSSFVNQILGNAIGTNLTGDAFPNGTSEKLPPQGDGVLIEGGLNNTVGGTGAGAANVLSGNVVGVQIAGLNQGNGVILGGSNVVAGNLIGTDWTGTQAVANLDVGVFVNNSAQNIIGPGNVLSANGIAGVELLLGASKANLIVGNIIGTSILGQRFPTPKKATLRSSNPQQGVPVFERAQSNGVVIIGASGNTVGEGNSISGNVQVGVYISSRDFRGGSYPRPVNNVVSGNTIQHDGLYGILLYSAPNNRVRPFTSQSPQLARNTFGGNTFNFRNFLVGFDIRTQLLKKTSSVKATHHLRRAPAKPAHVKAVHKSSLAVRPRVPRLFEAKPAVHPVHRDTTGLHAR